MTDFQTLVINKLASNFDKEDLKEAEALTNRIFLEETREGPKALEELLLNEIKLIIDKSGLNKPDLESLLEELEE